MISQHVSLIRLVFTSQHWLVSQLCQVKLIVLSVTYRKRFSHEHNLFVLFQNLSNVHLSNVLIVVSMGTS